ncbi:MAG: sodium-dependent transporter [Candidatus Cloacimonadota bacterium]|nr:MAG: sodium-dependent transporter [Candidatus Cloacimonadota bacterium]PIE78244.1 MAG: sodium-dependent transporter [Candidatus Delongbacteria bacterium]
MAKQKRGQWGSKMGFLLAVIGSAVGLGNIWRYPYMLYKNGGGAFLIPYFTAILVAGIPVLILEYGFGHKFRGSTPMSFARAHKGLEWIGWIPTFAAFVIMTFYSVILGWAVNYFVYAFDFSWGENTKEFFFKDFLNISEGAFTLGGFQFDIMVTVIVVWLINWFVTYKGVSGGIEKLNKVLIPTLLILMAVVVVKGVTLPGATKGLNVLFTPKWERLADISVWRDAFGQVFFSLSLALAAIITYASYLPKKTDLNNSAMITAFANCGFEFFAAIGIFGILGFMATSQGVDVTEVAGGGVGLAFVVFPKVFLTMGGIGKVLGVIFFLAIITAGLTSSVSLLEAFSSSVIDKTGKSRKKIVTITSIVCLSISLLYVTGAGLYILDIVDHFLNSYIVIGTGMLEAITIGWIIRADMIRKHNNAISIVKVGKWWNLVIKFIAPLVLGGILVLSIIDEFKVNYGDYPTNALLIYGVGTIVAVLVLSFITDRLPWRKGAIEGFATQGSDYKGEKEEG